MKSLTLKQVRKLLFTLSDKHLCNLLEQRKDNNSEFKKALLDEIASRAFIAVRNKYGIVKGNLKN